MGFRVWGVFWSVVGVCECVRWLIVCLGCGEGLGRCRLKGIYL